MSGGGHGGGRGGRRRGGGHAEEHENAERWMVTYADMLTLLLVLFIVLYAISAVNVSKFNQLKSSLSSAFNGGSSPSVLPGGSGIIAGQPQSPSTNVTVGPQGPTGQNATTGRPTAAAQAEAENFAKIEADLKAKLKAAGLAGDASFAINQKGLDVTVLTNAVTFTPNSSALQPGGETILNTIVPTLNSVDNQIEVDGNTNQVASAVNGWDLSAARAAGVVNYLIDQGNVAPNRLSGSFFGQYNPYVNPNDPAAVNLNRRVDIILLSKYSAADRVGLYTQSGSSTATTAAGTTP